MFKLLQPSGYALGFSVTGAIGSSPDTSLLVSSLVDFQRRRLPRFLSGLTFRYENQAPLRELFYCPPFFIATTRLKNELVGLSGAVFDSCSIRVLDQAGQPVEQAYWAMMVQTRIACIDGQRSTYRRGPLDPTSSPLSEGLYEVELGADVAGDYTNCSGGRYRSFEMLGLGNLPEEFERLARIARVSSQPLPIGTS